MTYILTLQGVALHHYGNGVYGWGPISSTTGQPGRLVEWTIRSEVEAWIERRQVFYRDAVIEHRGQQKKPDSPPHSGG